MVRSRTGSRHEDARRPPAVPLVPASAHPGQAHVRLRPAAGPGGGGGGGRSHWPAQRAPPVRIGHRRRPPDRAAGRTDPRRAAGGAPPGEGLPAALAADGVPPGARAARAAEPATHRAAAGGADRAGATGRRAAGRRDPRPHPGRPGGAQALHERLRRGLHEGGRADRPGRAGGRGPGGAVLRGDRRSGRTGGPAAPQGSADRRSCACWPCANASTWPAPTSAAASALAEAVRVVWATPAAAPLARCRPRTPGWSTATSARCRS